MKDPILDVRLAHNGPDDLPIILHGTADEIVTEMRVLWNQYRGAEPCDCGKTHSWETNQAMIDEMLAAHAQHNNIILGGYPKTHDRSAIAFLEVLQVAKQLTITGKDYVSKFNDVALPYSIGMAINAMLQKVT